MSKYTTGELAKLCDVSVRTVQYYDTRGILVPSKHTEGGRRLYTEDDLKRMKTICFLREAGLSINGIGQLYEEEHPEKIIAVLIEEEQKQMHEEIDECQKKLSMLDEISREVKNSEQFTVESIGDIANFMKDRKSLTKLRTWLIISGIPIDACEVLTILLWVLKGIWWPFAAFMVVALIYATIVSKVYFDRVAYICPDCHGVFRPPFKEAFFASHTPKLRKVTCTCCGKKQYCVEIYSKKESK